jgi:serine/threonine-protein kinase
MDALIEDTEAQEDPAGDPPTRRGDGRINGRYELKGELGSGGFATVYLAWDENLQRDVAVKIMRPELLQAEHRERFLQRFEREALLVARLDHNHLAPVYETGVFNHEGKDSAYIVMKYLEGMDLNDLLHKETLPIERTLLIMNQTLEALAYIHSQGVVHKDLKPSNIFLSQDHLGRDHVYLMDFGIAHDTQDERGRLTNTGMLAGTFQYMPPEYILQNMATPSVDVFQMGLIILEALTGSPLIHRSVTLPALVAHYLRQDPLDLPPPIAQSRAGQVIARAIEIDVDRRYADAGELLLAFSELTVDDFPSLTPTLRDDAERHSEELLSNPGQPRPTRETQPNIPSVREEDDQPTRRDTPPPALLPPPSSATELSASSDGRGNTALIAVGLIVAVAILGAVFALLTLRDPAPPADATASGTPTVAAPAAPAPAPETAPPEAEPPRTEPATPPPSEVPPPPTTDAPAEAAAAPTPEVEEPEEAPEEAPKKKARKPRKKPTARKTPVEKAPPVEKKPPVEEPPKEKVKKPTATLPPEL